MISFGRILAQADIVLRGHVLNWVWRPRMRRREVRGAVTRQAVGRYVDRYVLPPSTDFTQEPVPGSGQEEKMSSRMRRNCFRSLTFLIMLSPNTERGV